MVDQLESEIIGIIKNRVESEGGDGGGRVNSPRFNGCH